MLIVALLLFLLNALIQLRFRPDKGGNCLFHYVYTLVETVYALVESSFTYCWL